MCACAVSVESYVGAGGFEPDVHLAAFNSSQVLVVSMLWIKTVESSEMVLVILWPQTELEDGGPEYSGKGEGNQLCGSALSSHSGFPPMLSEPWAPLTTLQLISILPMLSESQSVLRISHRWLPGSGWGKCLQGGQTCPRCPMAQTAPFGSFASSRWCSFVKLNWFVPFSSLFD